MRAKQEGRSVIFVSIDIMKEKTEGKIMTIEIYEQVLEILRSQRGCYHSDVAVALDNLAKLYLLFAFCFLHIC